MIQPVGTITVNKSNNLISTNVTFSSFKVGSKIVGTNTEFVVASNSCFVQTSRELNSIIAKILTTQEKKKVTFLEALNIYLQSMDHFIRVRKSKNQ